VARLIPPTLFGRLALLLFVAVLASHVLALTLMFEVLGPPPGPDHVPGMRGEPPPRLHMGLWLDIGIRLSALMLAAWVGARWLSQPVLRLASAARDLGRDIHRPALVEEGTVECREATRVFNQMQAQICRQLAERDRFVAAVSHDLRTPLTRLALRTEALQDSAQRQQFARDIGEMNTLITSTLDYLRGAADPEPAVLLDLDSELHSLVDDYQETGHAVQMDAAAGQLPCAPLRTQATALRRCIGNLVDNAVRYGGGAQIRCIDAPDQVCIEVRDFGPGIAESELQAVLQPFYRLEGSRNRSSGGVGLGLSIAQDIARRLHGQLSLNNATPNGLVARVTLPR
jgi:protein-histidine pros-kinase